MELLYKIINSISKAEQVVSIGISGQLEPFPKPGEGDIDVFIYCEDFPDEQVRKKAFYLNAAQDISLSISDEPTWGLMDYCLIDKVETYFMYFKALDVVAYNKEILDGRQLWKINNSFFPVGRLAMLKGINILYDKDDFLRGIKDSLQGYPQELKEKMIAYHCPKMYDEEDFMRAVSRQDVFFCHSVLDTAIEHFLMTLFAMNETYFPSRKRTESHMQSFAIKPERCIERLKQVIKDAAEPKSIADACKAYKKLCEETENLL